MNKEYLKDLDLPYDKWYMNDDRKWVLFHEKDFIIFCPKTKFFKIYESYMGFPRPLPFLKKSDVIKYLKLKNFK